MSAYGLQRPTGSVSAYGLHKTYGLQVSLRAPSQPTGSIVRLSRRGRLGVFRVSSCGRTRKTPKPPLLQKRCPSVLKTPTGFFVCYRLVYSSVGCCSSARIYRPGQGEKLPAVVSPPAQVGARLGALAGTGSYRRQIQRERQSNNTHLTEAYGLHVSLRAP